MWRLWWRSPEGWTELKSSKEGRYCSLPKKRTRKCGQRKKVSRMSNRVGRERVLRKGERKSSRKCQKSAESRALRLLSTVGATCHRWRIEVRVTRVTTNVRSWKYELVRRRKPKSTNEGLWKVGSSKVLLTFGELNSCELGVFRFKCFLLLLLRLLLNKHS